MRVLKFGGTSVAHAANIRHVLQVVQAQHATPLVVVVSAFSGVTDSLIALATQAVAGPEFYKTAFAALQEQHLAAVRNLLPLQAQSGPLSQVKQMLNQLEDLLEGVARLQELSARTKDRIISYGELLSAGIVHHFFVAEGLPALWLDSRLLLKTDNKYGAATIAKKETYTAIANAIANANAPQPGTLFVAPGFIASGPDGSTTTLGRGGSDYTAALFAAALHADALEIWTDVPGIMTADPRHVPTARTLPQVSYQEAMELAHFGAKVLYPPTLLPVLEAQIPLYVKNTFAPAHPGTCVSTESNTAGLVTGLSSLAGMAALTLEGSGMVGVPGVAQKLFAALASQHINVVLITQSSSEHSICLVIKAEDATTAQNAVNAAFAAEIVAGSVAKLKVETGLGILALVGDRMRHHTGISGRMFGALGRNGINIRAIAQGASERNISTLLQAADIPKALNVLHSTFFEFELTPIHVFVAGVGNVGSRLLEQLDTQNAYLRQNLRLDVRLVGVANSRQIAINPAGLDRLLWPDALQDTSASAAALVHEAIALNLPNSVFVDATASATVAATYSALLTRSIAVVACNKIACSSTLENYTHLKDLAREYSTRFLFETNVGAGLPVLSTLADLRHSGDEITRIEAVLSGTLNFVFNTYNATSSFAEVVRQAQAEGYTEPDPRLDLAGTDVARKILILAREAGLPLELEQVSNTSFLPPSCMQGTVDDFYAQLAVHEAHFAQLYKAATAKGRKLKFVATLAGGEAAVGLQAVDPASDFFHLYGKDNAILFSTRRYAQQPLVIKGAGAGAEVTASGLFADIIRSANR